MGFADFFKKKETKKDDFLDVPLPPKPITPAMPSSAPQPPKPLQFSLEPEQKPQTQLPPTFPSPFDNETAFPKPSAPATSAQPAVNFQELLEKNSVKTPFPTFPLPSTPAPSPLTKEITAPSPITTQNPNIAQEKKEPGTASLSPPVPDKKPAEVSPFPQIQSPAVAPKTEEEKKAPQQSQSPAVPDLDDFDFNLPPLFEEELALAPASTSQQTNQKGAEKTIAVKEDKTNELLQSFENHIQALFPSQQKETADIQKSKPAFSETSAMPSFSLAQGASQKSFPRQQLKTQGPIYMPLSICNQIKDDCKAIKQISTNKTGLGYDSEKTFDQETKLYTGFKTTIMQMQKELTKIEKRIFS
ncbi:MAG: hypothetical protein QW594_00125 [Candidatus Woesearchaeota archaeon]